MSTTPSPPEDPCPAELDRATSCLEWSGEEECACFDPATFATSFPQTTFFEFSQTMAFVSATDPGFCKAANQRACEYYNSRQHCCCQDETLAYRKCFIDTFVVQQLPILGGDTCQDTCNTNIGERSPKESKKEGCNRPALGIGITLCLLLACGGAYYYWYRTTIQKGANNKVESKNKKLGDHNDEKPKTDAPETTGVNGVWNHMMVLLRPSKNSSSSQQEETKEMSTTTDNVPKDIEIGRRASSASSSYGWASPSGSSSSSSSSSCSSSSSSASSLAHEDLMKMEASHPEPHTESFGEIRSDSKHSVEKFPTANTESASLCSSSTMSPSPSDEDNDEDNPTRRKREASKTPTESLGESFGEIRCDSRHSVEKFPTANTESASLCSSSTMSPSPSDEDDDDDDSVREASKSKPKITSTESLGESFGEIRCDSKHSVEKFPTANAESASLSSSSSMSPSPSDEDNDDDDEDDDDEDCEFSEMTSTNPYPTFTSFSTMESEISRDRRHSPSSSIRKSGDPPSFVDSTKEQRHAKDKMAELDLTREELSIRLRRYEQQIESCSKEDDDDDDGDGDEPPPIKKDRDRLLQDYGQASLKMAQLEQEQASYKGRLSASESEAHRLRQDRVGNTRRIVELKAQNASLKRQRQQQQQIMEEHPSSSSSSSSQVKERPRYSRDVENPALTFLEEHRAMRNGGRGKRKSGKSMTTTSTKRNEGLPKSKSERLNSSETKRPQHADTTNGPPSSKVDELCLSWLDEPQSYGR